MERDFKGLRVHLVQVLLLRVQDTLVWGLCVMILLHSAALLLLLLLNGKRLLPLDMTMLLLVDRDVS